MHGRIAKKHIAMQGRVTHTREISALKRMAELQNNALQYKAVLHTAVKSVH